MLNTICYIFASVFAAIAVYIAVYLLVDRICRCIEHCSTVKGYAKTKKIEENRNGERK